MATTLAQFTTALETAFKAARDEQDPQNQDAALEQLAIDIATAVNSFIDQRDVTVANVTGVTSGGSTSGPGTGVVEGE